MIEERMQSQVTSILKKRNPIISTTAIQQGDSSTKSCASSDSTSSLSAASHASISGVSNNVSFGTIEIRNYHITISDNPSCRDGPAISFGWEYSDYNHKIPVDVFERIRDGKRYSESQLYISTQAREKILKLWGVSDEDIRSAQKEREIIQNQREETKAQELKKIRRSRRIKSFMKNVKNNSQRSQLSAFQYDW